MSARGSKRKEPEAKAPGTDESQRRVPQDQSGTPAALFFEDDKPPDAPKWGSDPDALNDRPWNAWQLKLLNTFNPSTEQKSTNCRLLYRVPRNMSLGEKEILRKELCKAAFGGKVTQVINASAHVDATLTCDPYTARRPSHQ